MVRGIRDLADVRMVSKWQQSGSLHVRILNSSPALYRALHHLHSPMCHAQLMCRLGSCPAAGTPCGAAWGTTWCVPHPGLPPRTQVSAACQGCQCCDCPEFELVSSQLTCMQVLPDIWACLLHDQAGDVCWLPCALLLMCTVCWTPKGWKCSLACTMPSPLA